MHWVHLKVKQIYPSYVLITNNLVVKKLMDAKIDCRPIVTGNFTRNDVMKYFDYTIHGELKNADYLHENGLFVGNHQIGLENEILDCELIGINSYPNEALTFSIVLDGCLYDYISPENIAKDFKIDNQLTLKDLVYNNNSSEQFVVFQSKYFIKSDIVYEMLGVEHLEFYNHKFDFIFMLGVLYHRPDPVGTLKSLARGLNSKGEILIDTFMIDGDEELCLTPNKRYSKIPNIYFIPTIPALKNWLERAGFENIEVLATTVTTSEEQRKTPWSFDQSLEDFLDENDKTKTVEGYPAPKRVYVKARKVL